MFTTLFLHTRGNTVQLGLDNIDNILKNNELVLINFYADWCRFSQMLSPIFEDTAKKIKEKFPEEGRVVLAKVDCDKETSIAQRFHVSKYPTIKMVRHGEIAKREYRGQRSVDSIEEFVSKQLINPIKEIFNLNEINAFDTKKGHVIGYFDENKSDDYKLFLNLASSLRDECIFYSAIGEVSASERAAGNKIVFLKDNTHVSYDSSISNQEDLKRWTSDKCTPLVREITFANAEELTEEGLPFVILFHDPSDENTPEVFKKIVARELLAEKGTVNFLIADGNKFSHPLHHLGKSTADLPVLAIDSFRHMYVWKYDVRNNIGKQGFLKTFIADLHSGKLHREFHNGPDPTIPAIEQESTTAAPVMRVVQKEIQKLDGKKLVVVKIVDDISGSGEAVTNIKQAVETRLEALNSSQNMANEGGEEILKVTKKLISNEVIDGSTVLPSPGDNIGVELKNVKTRKFIDKDNNKVIERSIDVHAPNMENKNDKKDKKPPKSMFQHLQPSRDRYTFSKDEL